MTQRPEPVSKGRRKSKAGADLKREDHNMNVGLVVPGMFREHGLPLGWRPRAEGEVIKVHSNTLEGIEHSTGLALPGMHRENGLPNGWSELVAPAGPPANQFSSGVAASMGAD
jgi:hypothetical protein